MRSAPHVAGMALGANLPDPLGGSDAADTMWVPVDLLLRRRRGPGPRPMQILRDGVKRARAKLEYSPLATAFCEPEFTVGSYARHTRGSGTPGWTRATSTLRSQAHPYPTYKLEKPQNAAAAALAQLFRAGPAVLLNPPITRG